MDTRSRLERQKARLRERLQDSSARVAAGRGEGVGGGSRFFSLSRPFEGSLRFDGSSGFASGYLFVQSIHISDYSRSLGSQRVCK